VTPTPPAIRELIESRAVQIAPPVVRDWLVSLLLHGEKEGRRTEPCRREKAPVREAADPGR
jgi:hypothetical protein